MLPMQPLSDEYVSQEHTSVHQPDRHNNNNQAIDEDVDKDIVYSSIDKFKTKQINIYNKLSTFCIRIGDAIQQSVTISIGDDIIKTILSFTNHHKIQKRWLSIFHKLKQLSWNMKDGCSIQEIQGFEKRMHSKWKGLKLPHDVRVSLMLCNSIGIYPMHKSRPSEWHYIDSILSPLTHWKIDSFSEAASLIENVKHDEDAYVDEEELCEFKRNLDYQILIGYFDEGEIFLDAKTGAITCSAFWLDGVGGGGISIYYYPSFEAYLSIPDASDYTEEYFKECDVDFDEHDGDDLYKAVMTDIYHIEEEQTEEKDNDNKNRKRKRCERDFDTDDMDIKRRKLSSL